MSFDKCMQSFNHNQNVEYLHNPLQFLMIFLVLNTLSHTLASGNIDMFCVPITLSFLGFHVEVFYGLIQHVAFHQ